MVPFYVIASPKTGHVFATAPSVDEAKQLIADGQGWSRYDRPTIIATTAAFPGTMFSHTWHGFHCWPAPPAHPLAFDELRDCLPHSEGEDVGKVPSCFTTRQAAIDAAAEELQQAQQQQQNDNNDSNKPRLRLFRA